MLAEAFCVVASFTSPEAIRVNAWSMLWMFPLAAAIAVVYKATKVEKVTPADFIKETAALFGTITVCMIIAAVVLCGLAWLLAE